MKGAFFLNMKPMDDSALREVPVKKESIYEGHILHVEKWTVTCPNGRQAPRELVLHKGAAAVIPVFPTEIRCWFASIASPPTA